MPTRAVLTDIEGTTAPIAFVHEVLFPYARARLPGFLLTRGNTPEVAAILAAVSALAPGVPPEAALLGWMDQDAKVTPLKTLQGLIWADGYASGELKGAIYPDVPPALRSWHAGGIRLYVYSSGSEAAQRQIFANATAGNLAPLFGYFFDTRFGAKREPASYISIARVIALPPEDILFLSDVGPELDAAAAAGYRTCQLVRPQDGTKAWPGHKQASDFTEIPDIGKSEKELLV